MTSPKSRTAIRYQAVYDDLLERVRQGVLRPGQRLSPERTLCREFGVSMITVRRALQMLAEEGVIEHKTPVEKSDTFCCTDTELSEIGRLVKELENHFNEPQDIEWAITEDIGFPDVILLQARPAVVVKKSASDAVVDMMVGMFRK